MTGPQEAQANKKSGTRLLVIAITCYFAFSLPYALTKLSGDEVHFATLPYLMLGGDYALGALKKGEYRKALEIAGQSYLLAWRYYVRPADADEHSAAVMNEYASEFRISPDIPHSFVFTEDYFATHRKPGRPLLSFLLNIPSFALTLLLPSSLVHYQREYVYHPAFVIPRLTSWILGFCCLLLVHRLVLKRWGAERAGYAAILFSLLPPTAIWSADLHQDVPLTFFVILFVYYWSAGRMLLAAVFWGLAFGTKNQAIYALVPFVLEAIWRFCDAGSFADRARRAWSCIKQLTFIFTIGLIVSAPFGYPVANLAEILRSSVVGFDLDINGNLFFFNPMWRGMALLALLGLGFLDEVRDSFDRYWLFFLLCPAFLHIFTNYRTYMLLPGVAILVASHFRTKTIHCTVVGLGIIGLWGIESPYLTTRGLNLRRPLRDYPATIGDIERLPGVGSIRAEEQRAWEKERKARESQKNQGPDKK